MISKVLALVALFGAAVAAPVRQVTSTGITAGGAGFDITGSTTAGAAADTDSGIASGGIDGIGSVIGAAGPGFATAASLASPSL